MAKDNILRYARHLVLKEIGGPGQQALKEARILIVGAGGLGGPAGLYLAAAGIGTIGLIDDDRVDLSNLQRQVQFEERDIGAFKAEIMARRLEALNSDITVIPHTRRFEADKAQTLCQGYDLILDGTDNFPTRFLINKTAFDLKIPLVFGALGRFEGQVGVLASDGEGPCYQCFVPDIPPDGQSCADVGVVGALAGLIGSMMALEAIKIITDAGKPLYGALWIYDGLTGAGRTVRLTPDPQCPVCGHRSK